MALAVPNINDDPHSPTGASPSPQQNDDDLINKYFAQIEEQYEVAEQLIDAIEKDQDAINHGDSKATQKLQDDLYQIARNFGIPWHHNATDFPDVDSLFNAFVEAMKYAGQDFSTYTTYQRQQVLLQWISQTYGHGGDVSMKDLRKQCNPYLQQVAALNKDITDKEDQLKVIDPKFVDLINALETLRDSRKTEAEDGTETSQDRTIILNAFKALFQAMRDKCNTDRLEAMISAAGSSPDISDSDLESLAFQSMASQSAEQTGLQKLEDSLLAASDAFADARDKAKLDKDKHWWGHDGTDAFKHGEIGSERRAKDEAIIENANKMIKLIANVDKSLAGEMGSMESPVLYQIGMILDKLMKEITQILGGDLSPGAKKDKVLLAMTMALGAVNRLKAEVAKEKDALEKMIADAAEKGSLANIRSIAAESAQMAVLKSNAEEMKGFMKALKITLTVIGFMFAAFTGGASLALMAVTTGLDESGETDKWTRELARALARDGCHDSQLVAEIIVGTCELGLMVGAGALDGLDAAEVEGAATATREAAEIMVKEAEIEVENALKNIAPQLLEDMEKQSTQKVVDATKLVDQKLARMKWRQTLPNIIRSLAKQTVKKDAEKSAELVMNEVRAEFKQMLQNGDRALLKEIEQTPEQIANKVIAQVRGTTPSMIEKASAKDTAAKMAARTFYQSLYVAGSRNIIVDFMLASAKAHGHDKDSDTYQTLEVIANVLQAMIMGVGGYKSMGPQLALEGMPLWFSRINTAANMAQMGATSTLEGSQAVIAEKQAGTVQAIAHSQAANQGFQFLLKRLFDQQKIELNSYIEEENRTAQTSYKMASKLESMEVETDLLRVLQVTV